MKSPFPVTYSILSSEDLMNDLLPDYEIGEIADCHFFSSGFNDTYRVRTVSGDTYYMRIYRLGWRTLPDILHELDVLEREAQKLSGNAPPAAAGWQLPGSCQLQKEPGLPSCFLRLQASSSPMIKSLIRWHSNTGRQSPACTMPWTISPAAIRASKSIWSCSTDAPLRNIRPFLADRAANWTYLQDFAARLRQRILDLPAADLELGYCHGDFKVTRPSRRARHSDLL